MSLSCQSAARSCIRSLRSSSSLRVSTASLAQRRNPSARWASTEAASANPKISGIVDQIITTKYSRYANGGFSAGPVQAAAPVEEEDAAPVQQEKTLFNLKLASFDAGAKPKIIKEIKSMLGLSLVDSKKFVESAPKMMKEGVPKEEAEKIIATLKELGAVVNME
ncbi:50s ribosomal protein l12 [Botrytis cinerea]